MIRFWTYKGIGLLHARYATHRFAPHFHDDYSIAVILGGALEFKCEGDNHHAGPDTISAVNPGVVHTGQPGVESGWEYLHFFMPPIVLSTLVPELNTASPELRRPVIQDPAVAQALIAAHRAATSDVDELEKDALLTEAFGALFSKHANDTSIAPRLSRATTRAAQDFIRAHFTRKIRLDELAGAVGVSPFHFLRTFAQDTGLTPHAYQQQVRIAYGLERLKQGVASADAATDAGYADQSHFIRAMKRTYGVTPSRVQRSA